MADDLVDHTAGTAPDAPARFNAHPSNEPEALIQARGVQVGFGDRLILDGLDLDVRRGEVLGVVGASGTGKSVLLRTIIGLAPMSGGSIHIFGQDYANLNLFERQDVDRRWGVLFQQGALFSSLTVKQNIQVPMREYLDLSPRLLEDMAMLKLAMVGLKPEAADRLPSELSGGMIKRAALARALALDPDLVFLDEPTSGLDPISAGEFDELIATLRQTLGLTVYMVTHDLDSLHTICDRIAVVGEGRIIAEGPMEQMLESDHPWLQAYFHGPRARAALQGSVQRRTIGDSIGRIEGDTSPLTAGPRDPAALLATSRDAGRQLPAHRSLGGD